MTALPRFTPPPGPDAGRPATTRRPQAARPVPSPRPARRRIGDTLVATGALTPEQLDICLRLQSQAIGRSRRRLGRIAVEEGFATERQVAESLALALDLPFVDLRTTAPDRGAGRLLPAAVCDRYRLLPLGMDGPVLRLAVTDALEGPLLRLLARLAGAEEVAVHIAAEPDMREHVLRIWTQD